MIEKDTVFSNIIRRNNYKFLVANMLLLVFICTALYALKPLVYNAVYGPFEISADELIQMSEEEYKPQSNSFFVRTFYPYYAKDDKFYFSFPVDYYIKEKGFFDDVESVVSDYRIMMIAQDKKKHLFMSWFYRFNGRSLPPKITGVFKYINSQSIYEGNLIRVIPSEKLGEMGFFDKDYLYLDMEDHHFEWNANIGAYVDEKGNRTKILYYDSFPYDFVDSNSDTLNLHYYNEYIILWTYIFSLAITIMAIICYINFIKLYKRFRHIENHPIFKKIREIDEVAAELEKGYTKRKTIYETDNWMVWQKHFTICAIKKTKHNDRWKPNFKGFD